MRSNFLLYFLREFGARRVLQPSRERNPKRFVLKNPLVINVFFFLKAVIICRLNTLEILNRSDA